MNIQKLRVDKGWSQEELAAHSGLSVRTIQRIENGKRASLESLKCLAAVFETQVSELIQEIPMNDTQTSDQYFLDQAEQEIVGRLEAIRQYLRNPDRDPHLSMEEIFKKQSKNGRPFKDALRDLFRGRKKNPEETDEAHA